MSNYMKYWAKAEDPEYGEYMESILGYLRWANNDSGNMDDFIESSYGEQLAIMTKQYFWYGIHPNSSETEAFYDALGLKRIVFDDIHFYSRWVLLVPKEMYTMSGVNKKYPLVFVNRAGDDPVERVEFGMRFNNIAGREGFMACYPQNTNPEQLEYILDRLEAEYPIDTERVYVTGYSSGGQQTTSAAFAFPERLAAYAPCGNDIYRNMDLAAHEYTKGEEDRLRDAFLPFMQMVGCCEHSNIVPMNVWRPKLFKGGVRMFINLPKDIRTIVEKDPTDVTGGKYIAPAPPQNVNPNVWKLQQLNKRLGLLNCSPRDVDKCLSYSEATNDELHHVLGFYGDREEIVTHFGYKHYIINIDNADGINAFRYVAVENSPHVPGVMLGELVWGFFKQFRRDYTTKKIVQEKYIYKRT